MRRYGLAVGFVLALTGQANAETYSGINANLAAYCTLYSREMVFIKVMHPTETITADPDEILELAKKEYGDCLAVLPTLLPLPREIGSLKGWIADMRDLIILRAGTKPATENPDDETWRTQCRAEYRTWDEETGTVVRSGSSARVRCPCGAGVQCGP